MVVLILVEKMEVLAAAVGRKIHPEEHNLVDREILHQHHHHKAIQVDLVFGIHQMLILQVVVEVLVVQEEMQVQQQEDLEDLDPFQVLMEYLILILAVEVGDPKQAKSDSLVEMVALVEVVPVLGDKPQELLDLEGETLEGQQAQDPVLLAVVVDLVLVVVEEEELTVPAMVVPVVPVS